MSTDEQQIRDLVATWMRATKAGDIDTVLDLMTEDVIFLVVGRDPMVGRAAFASSARPKSGQAPQFDGTSDIQEVVVSGDVAWMWTRLRVVVTPPGGQPPFTRAGTTLSVLRKEGGRWRIARDANLLTTVAPPAG